MNELQIRQEELQNAFRECIKANAIIEKLVDDFIDMRSSRIYRALYGKTIRHGNALYEFKGTIKRVYNHFESVDTEIYVVLFKKLPDYGPLTEKERELVVKIDKCGDCEKVCRMNYDLRYLKHRLDVVEELKYSYNLTDMLREDFLKRGLDWDGEILIESRC